MQVEQGLAAVSGELQQAHKEDKAAHTQHEGLEKVVHHDQKKLDSAEHPFILKKVLLPHFCEKQVERREGRLHAHEEQLHAAIAAEQAADGHVADAAARQAALTVQVQQLHAAQAEAGQLLDCVLFNEAGSAPFSAADPSERSLAAQVHAARGHREGLQAQIWRDLCFTSVQMMQRV